MGGFSLVIDKLWGLQKFVSGEVFINVETFTQNDQRGPPALAVGDWFQFNINQTSMLE